MSLTPADVIHLLIALTLLILAAHAIGNLFALVRQPPVIGEILGGLLLGPTVLGTLAPGIQHRLFPTVGITASVLGALYELGLLFLMFLVGTELRLRAEPGERRTVTAITVAGLVLPFAIGMTAVRAFDPARFVGPNGTPQSFGLIFGIAIAVTSIPVISRIMMDLGMLNTPFARIVLTAAVLEDIALYTVLAVVLGIAQAQTDSAHGLWALVGTDSVALTGAYYVIASLLFFAITFACGPYLFRRLAGSRLNIIERRSPTAFRILLLFAMVLCCGGLGINTVFGALLAGTVCARVETRRESPQSTANPKGESQTWLPLKQFSLAFFVPVYFAIVGLKLNLVRDLDAVFLGLLIIIACAAKGLSVWAGARLAGEGPRSAANLAIAMNARGGPGIVLATVTFSAGLINERFFTALVLLSILTSQLAGFWLDRAINAKTATDLATHPPIADPRLVSAPAAGTTSSHATATGPNSHI
jgi:Kef-type K+ transport system membrane component KefB